MMDSLNKELIDAKKSLMKLDKQNKTSTKKYKFLQDKIHLYFDSIYDTTEAEKFIIGTFWAKAYDVYKDGGYITNDLYVAKARFKYESMKLKKMIKKHCIKQKRALDIGCGDGRYTREFAKDFKEVVGIDLSKKRVEANNSSNSCKNVKYLNENFITMKKDKLGKFDFVFVGDIFMYTTDAEIENVFQSLLKLLKKDGVLIIRESTLIHNEGYWKSKGYVAYYRNVEFYKNGVFKESFKKAYRNYGYSLYYLDKFFNIFPNKRKKILQKPKRVEKIVKKFVDIYKKSSHFYIHKV